jgi:hypothetical protein
MHLNSLNCPVARARGSTAASLHHRSRPCVVAKHSKRDNAASSAKPAAADRAEVGGNHQDSEQAGAAAAPPVYCTRLHHGLCILADLDICFN